MKKYYVSYHFSIKGGYEHGFGYEYVTVNKKLNKDRLEILKKELIKRTGYTNLIILFFKEID